MDTTTNYGLSKPGLDGPADIEVLGQNADIVDTELKKAQDHRENPNVHMSTAEKGTLNSAVQSATFGGTAVPQDGTKLEIPMPTAGQVGASNPNLLINGDFQIWQRGISFEVENHIYTADRWRTVQWSNVSKSSNGMLIKGNSTDGCWGIGQVLSNNDYPNLQNKTITLSVRMKVYQNHVLVAIVRNGTEYVASKFVDSSDDFITVAITGTVSTFNELEVSISKSETGTPGENAVEIQWAKLELGTAVTLFSPRPYAEELATCKRYYQRNKWLRYRICASTSGIKRIESTRQEFDIEMRIAPTMRLLRTDGIANIHTYDFSSNYNDPTTEQASIEEALYAYNSKMYSLNITLGTIPIGPDYAVDIKDNTLEFDAEIY